MANTPKERKGYNDDFVTKVLREAKAGAFVQDLEKKYGVTYSTILKWCSHVNIRAKKRATRLHDWEAIKKDL